MRKMSKKMWVAIASAAVVVVLAVTGMVIGAVNSSSAEKTATARESGSPHPAPTGTKPADKKAGDPTGSGSSPGLPSFDSVTLTKEGWMPIPLTHDPRVFAAAASAALWTYDTSATTRATTLAHFVSFTDPGSGYAGRGITYPMSTRQAFSENTGDKFMKSRSDFLQLQTQGTKVTAKVIAQKMDSEISTFPTDAAEVWGAKVAGQHLVTTTLAVFFSGGTAAGGDDGGGQRIIISMWVSCYPPDDLCGVVRLMPDPEL
jgi:hypothetical protein